MKTFMYFENQEGGMDYFKVSNSMDLARLSGWMKERFQNNTEDVALVDWMEDAEVGDYAEHRLGVMVRVKDTE